MRCEPALTKHTRAFPVAVKHMLLIVTLIRAILAIGSSHKFPKLSFSSNKEMWLFVTNF